MPLEVVVKEFDPVEFVYGKDSGKLILARDADESNTQQLFCYGTPRFSYPLQEFTHKLAAKRFGVEGLVMGGAETTCRKDHEQYELEIYGDSILFGGIPAPVVDLMFTALDSHLKTFDYDSSERKVQEAKFASNLESWRKRIAKMKEENARARSEYETRVSQAEALRKKRMCSWINKLRAWWNNVSIGYYVDGIYEYQFIAEPVLAEIPAKEPEYRFYPRFYP